MKALFIGNSHTYYNSMPQMVKELFEATGEKSHVTMSTEGGKCLSYHCERKDVVFNIRYGEYDVVVLQGKATHFDPDDFVEAGKKMLENSLSQVPARRVLYLIWANRVHPEEQPMITEGFRRLAAILSADIAPAGEVWHGLIAKQPELADVFYREDGNHATPIGSYLAATTLFYTLSRRETPLPATVDTALCERVGIDPTLRNLIHETACEAARAYRFHA